MFYIFLRVLVPFAKISGATLGAKTGKPSDHLVMQQKSSAVIADLLLFWVFFFLVWGLDSGLGEMIRFGDRIFSHQIAGWGHLRR